MGQLECPLDSISLRVASSLGQWLLLLLFSLSPGIALRHSSCQGVCGAGAGYISQALKEHTNERLVDIDLGYNEIKDEGACAVAQVRAMTFSD